MLWACQSGGDCAALVKTNETPATMPNQRRTKITTLWDNPLAQVIGARREVNRTKMREAGRLEQTAPRTGMRLEVAVTPLGRRRGHFFLNKSPMPLTVLVASLVAPSTTALPASLTTLAVFFTTLSVNSPMTFFVKSAGVMP